MGIFAAIGVAGNTQLVIPFIEHRGGIGDSSRGGNGTKIGKAQPNYHIANPEGASVTSIEPTVPVICDVRIKKRALV